MTRDCLAVGLAVGASGVTFGAAGTAAGLSVAQSCAASLLIFTGASQFALLGVLAGGGSALAGVAAALALGLRNSLYGLRLADLLRLRGPRRLLSAQLVTDETTAMAIGQASVRAHAPVDRGLARHAFLVTGAALFLSWNLATLGGAVAAGAVGDPAAFGIDAAVPAAFLALVAPRLREPTSRRTGLIAVGLALAVVPVVPAGVPVLLAAFAVGPVLLRRSASPESR